MTTTAWQIEFVDASAATDLTSSVLGFSLTQNLQIGRMSSYYGNMTLDNTGNLFTPNAGGTYASFNWFQKLVKLTFDIAVGETTKTAEAAYLVVQDIRFNDDGAKATVELILADPFTYASRDAVEAIDVAIAYGTLDAVSQTIVNGATGITRVAFPKFGASSATVSAINKKNNVDPQVSSETVPLGYAGIIDEFLSGTAKDHINSQILPSGPSLIYPTTATYSSNTWTLNAAYVNRLLTKETVSSTNHYRLFEFTETATADKYPIRRLSVQMNTKDAVNQAVVQAVYPVGSEGANTTNNSTSQDTIGIRSISFDKIIAFIFGGLTQAGKDFIGSFWTNRYNAVTFTPQQLELSVEATNPNIDASSQDNYHDLIDVTTGLWNIAKITYTPTGASSSQTHVSVITGRTFNVTPNGTQITLRLLSGVDNSSLKLDDTTIGVLNTNRVG